MAWSGADIEGRLEYLKGCQAPLEGRTSPPWLLRAGLEPGDATWKPIQALHKEECPSGRGCLAVCLMQALVSPASQAEAGRPPARVTGAVACPPRPLPTQTAHGSRMLQGAPHTGRGQGAGAWAREQLAVPVLQSAGNGILDRRSHRLAESCASETPGSKLLTQPSQNPAAGGGDFPKAPTELGQRQAKLLLSKSRSSFEASPHPFCAQGGHEQHTQPHSWCAQNIGLQPDWDWLLPSPQGAQGAILE